MKLRVLTLILICILILTGCEKTKNEKNDSQTNKKTPPKTELTEELEEEEIGYYIPDLSIDQGIKEYLIGEWITDKENLSDYLLTESDINCNMIIDEDLNVELSFYNRETNDLLGDYMGKIELDRLNSELNEPADLISIELENSDWPGGDFLFKHRTVYDGKIVMSLFYSGNGNCIFDMLADIDNFEYAPEEIIFEKLTDLRSELSSNKDSEFYGVFWGKERDGEGLWIDEVLWTPPEEYDPEAVYPTRMTLYEDDIPESVLYSIAEDKLSYILDSPIYAGEVYYIKTDKNGDIIDLEDAQYKESLEEREK